MIKPTDSIKDKIGKTVSITLKTGLEYKGKLISVDDNLNISINTEAGTFICSGKNIAFISFSQ